MVESAGERRVVSAVLVDIADSTAIGEQPGPERSKFLFDEVVRLPAAEVKRPPGSSQRGRGWCRPPTTLGRSFADRGRKASGARRSASARSTTSSCSCTADARVESAGNVQLPDRDRARSARTRRARSSATRARSRRPWARSCCAWSSCRCTTSSQFGLRLLGGSRLSAAIVSSACRNRRLEGVSIRLRRSRDETCSVMTAYGPGVTQRTA
jgi:hypothetical protein